MKIIDGRETKTKTKKKTNKQREIQKNRQKRIRGDRSYSKRERAK